MDRLKNSKPSLLVVVAVMAATAGFLGVKMFNKGSDVAANACSANHCVQLRSEAAAPDTLAIPVGDTVQFSSADGQQHSLSLGAGGSEHEHSGPFSSGDFGADEAWKVQFKEKGTFLFHDHYNPKINVLVVVYQPGGDYKITR